MIAGLVLVGYVLALCLSLLLWWRRPGLTRAAALALTAALTGAATVLVTATDWPAGSRVVLVLDQSSSSPEMVSGVQAVLARLRTDGLAGYDVVTINAAAQDVNEATLAARRWRVLDWTAGEDLTAPDAEAALRLAARRLRTARLGDRLLDTICLRNRRVILLATAPKSWDKQRLPVAALVEVMQQAGTTVDLLLDPVSDPTPVLEILLDRPALAPNGPPEPTAEFRLRLRSPILTRHAGTDLPVDVKCNVNPGNPDKTQTFTLARTGTGVVGPDGAVTVRVAFAGFEPVLTLPSGFHLLSCRLSVKVEGKELIATREHYVRVGDQQVIFVAGTGGRLAAGANKIALGNAWEKIARWTGRWPAGVDFLGSEKAPWHNFKDEEQFLDLDPATSRPLIVVLHDLSEKTWTDPKTEPLLKRWLTNGTHLLVCGAPPDKKELREKLQFLPAFAAMPAGGGTAPLRVERRPRLIFVRDRSRLGRLPFGPSASKEVFEAGGLESLKFRQPGEALQTELIKAVCDRLHIKYETVAANPAAVHFTNLDKSYVRPGVLTVSGLDALAEPVADLLRPSAIDRRLACLVPQQKDLPEHELVTDGKTRTAAARAVDEVGMNDVVVLLSYDGINQPDDRSGALARLLRAGVTVAHVRLRSPFTEGANKESAKLKSSLSQTAYINAELGRLPDAALFPSSEPATADEAKGRFIDAGVISLTPPDPGGLSAVVNRIEAAAKPRFYRRSLVIVRHRLDRFIDERVGPALDKGRPDKKVADMAAAAPLRFQKLLQVGGNLYASVVAPTEDTQALASVPLAVGTLVDRGHVLCLGYSLFEGAPLAAPSVEPFVGVAFRDYGTWPARDRIFPTPYSSEIDQWGPQRVIDLAMFCADLEPAPTETPQLRDVSVMDARGRVRLECVVQLADRKDKAIAVPTLRLTVPKGEKGTEKRPDRSVALTPADLDPPRGRVGYELLPTESEYLLGRSKEPSKPGQPALPGGLVQVEGTLVYLGGRELAVQPDLTGLAEAAAVASYSGGVEVDRPAALPAYPIAIRMPMVFAFSVLLSVLWGWRVVRRWLRWRAAARQAEQETVRSMHLDAEGLVAQAGESLGRPSAVLRAGAFAGFRTFEPGDRLELAVREDLVLSALFDIPLIPRVPLRIDDRATRLLLVVHVGLSMRIPASGHGLPPPKMAIASAIVELLAALAWTRRAEVTVRLVGLPEPVTLGPLPASPGPGELMRSVLAEAARPSRWGAPLGLPPPDEGGGSVVYISDCLNEDLQALVAGAAAVEQDNGAAGAVLVSSPAEFQLLDLGFAPGAGVFCERSEWASTDLEAAFRLFAEHLAAAWDQTRGGLVVVHAGMTGEQLLTAVRESRLLELLR